jgi:hypothetical protein
MSHQVGGVRALITIAAALLLLAGCASAHHTTPSAAVGGVQTTSSPVGATVTKVRVFAPFDRSGAPTAGVAAHRSGSCFTTSITVMAADAYRCFAGNSILDPCFVSPDANRVLECYPSPWGHPTELRVHKLPTATTTVKIARPWAIQLVGGQRCLATNGTPSILRGIPLSYKCVDGFAGMRKYTGRTMKALYRASDGLVGMKSVMIAWSSSTN